MSAQGDHGFVLATELLTEIGSLTRGAAGIDRPSYGAGETLAMDHLRRAAVMLDLDVAEDFARNLYITLAGSDPRRRTILIGSHVDAVPNGGNFDGLAGVAAGIGILADLRQMHEAFPANVTVMAIRAEENAWFGGQHIGSRAALGLLSPELLDTARRVDSGRGLGEHMAEAGVDFAAIRRRDHVLAPDTIRAFFELHIEQGPALVALGQPIAVVPAIRGNTRCIELRCTGSYGHSGAVPMTLRNDAVVAAARLVAAMADHADRVNASGGDLVVTFGRFFTDATAHGLTTIPGEVTFSFDCRSHDTATLEGTVDHLERLFDEIGQAQGVSWTHSGFRASPPCLMDAELIDRLAESCRRMTIEPVMLASGAGHDAQDFAEAGIPAAMLFVRNDHGSHNPAEMMELADFRVAFEVLRDTIVTLAREDDQ